MKVEIKLIILVVLFTVWLGSGGLVINGAHFHFLLTEIDFLKTLAVAFYWFCPYSSIYVCGMFGISRGVQFY